MTQEEHKAFTDRQFTIIELLVVITIITVLVSMLLPALKKSKEYARTVQCLSNLKQCAVAAQTYASESEGGYLPDSENNYYGTGSDISPASVLCEYNYAKGNLFLCPNSTDYIYYSILPPSPHGYWRYMTIGTNPYYTKPGLTVPLTKTRNASKKILFGDIYALTSTDAPRGGFYFSNPATTIANVISKISDRHNGNTGGNLVFVDGHAKTEKNPVYTYQIRAYSDGETYFDPSL